MEKDDKYQVGVEFEMDAIEGGEMMDIDMKYYLNEAKTCYFEFDGNKTLEFVTNPYEWSNQTSASEALFRDLCLAENKIQEFYQESNQDLVNAAKQKKVKPRDADKKSLIINSYWPLGVPQITFQFPMHQYENFQNWTKSLFKRSPKVLKCFDFEMADFLGIGFENETFCLEIKGLAYLCIVTIKSLRTMTLSYREAGPKSCLAFMSRLSFRSMYLSLDKTQQRKFNEYIERALEAAGMQKGDKLFPDYGTPLDMLLSQTKARVFTIQDFINSVVRDDFDYSFEVLEGEMEVFGPVYETPKRDRNTTDLLSPPPFMEEDYAMGALSRGSLKHLVKSKHFVLEFRAAAVSILYDEYINNQRWVLSSSAEKIETTAFYFYHSMIQSFEAFFIAKTDLLKIGDWNIQQIEWIMPRKTRNLLWRNIVKIRRRRKYLGEEKKIVIIAILNLIAVFQENSGDKFKEKFGPLFNNKLDDGSIYQQVIKMNDYEQEEFCSIATELLLLLDNSSKFKKKDK